MSDDRRRAVAAWDRTRQGDPRPDGARPGGARHGDGGRAGDGPTARCPVCRLPAEQRWRPFCSRRCADVDLGRWITGRYAIATDEAPDGGDDG